MNAPVPETRLSPFLPAGPRPAAARHRVLIVGGGAGGLELAVRLGESLGRRGQAEVALVDGRPTHFWKPLLHELAAGTLAPDGNELDFLQQARRHSFRFHLGTLAALDRRTKEVWLDPLMDDEGGEVAPRRAIWYDTLVLALGCVDNDFGIPGVGEYAFHLNSPEDAQRLHRRLLALCVRAEVQGRGPVRMVIVGGGATGVELASELTEAGKEIASYGTRLRRFPQPVQLTLVESGARLVGALPPEVSARAQGELRERGIEIRLQQKVAQVGKDRVLIDSEAGQEELAADVTVWAAGIRGSDILAHLDGLEVNRLNQLVVLPSLQTSRDPDIFAMGDCAACPQAGAKAGTVPPMAQAAHQEARFLAQALARRLEGKALPDFIFRSRGSLVSLGQHDAVGSLMGWALGKGFTVEGLVARFSYWALYRRHLATLLGWMRTLAGTLGEWLAGRSQPRVKLH